jgi:hypothetical protein
MGLFCFRRDQALSRLLDGELPLREYQRLQAHVRACPRCAGRLAAFRRVDLLLAGLPPGPVRLTPAPLAIALAAAAALLASLAANFFLPTETATPAGVYRVEPPLSEAMSGLYQRLTETGGGR